jgi:hypothetical protein
MVRHGAQRTLLDCDKAVWTRSDAIHNINSNSDGALRSQVRRRRDRDWLRTSAARLNNSTHLLMPREPPDFTRPWGFALMPQHSPGCSAPAGTPLLPLRRQRRLAAAVRTRAPADLHAAHMRSALRLLLLFNNKHLLGTNSAVPASCAVGWRWLTAVACLSCAQGVSNGSSTAGRAALQVSSSEAAGVARPKTQRTARGLWLACAVLPRAGRCGAKEWPPLRLALSCWARRATHHHTHTQRSGAGHIPATCRACMARHTAALCMLARCRQPLPCPWCRSTPPATPRDARAHRQTAVVFTATHTAQLSRGVGGRCMRHAVGSGVVGQSHARPL